MFTMKSSQKQKFFGCRAQAIVEFAIALPILLALLVGILEVGRMVFIYTAVTNASREAVRYASAVGLDDSGNAKYQYCDGIRNMARRSAYFLNLTDSDIDISYDSGPSTTMFDTCTGSVDTGVLVNSGSSQDRVVVEVTAIYKPMVNLIPIGPKTITSTSARTILGVFNMTTGQSSAPGPGGPGSGSAPTSTPTATPSNTPTATPTDTPTATSDGPFLPVTPIPSSTPSPTDTPTITPTGTLQSTVPPTNTPTATSTFTPTFTPTATSTAVPGCGNITHGAIANSGSTLTMTITNPHESLTVQNIQVTWNHDFGGPGKDSSALTLQYVTFEGRSWAVVPNETGPSATITPSPVMMIPGNNVTSTITFIFHKAYQTLDGTESIIITLSTPGCENYPIHNP